jgi:uncharacterized repeat protein (TIGR03803 family)
VLDRREAVVTKSLCAVLCSLGLAATLAGDHATASRGVPDTTDYEILHVFGENGDSSLGRTPSSPLTRGADGLLYGTTRAGGSDGWGTIYRIDERGTFASLRSFPTEDAGVPSSRIIQASDGQFYGTSTNSGPGFVGLIWRYNATTNTLNSTGLFGAGRLPRSGLIQASDGNFYGTAWEGGLFSQGTIFRGDLVSDFISAAILRSFKPADDGSSPSAPLLEGPDHNFYGTAGFDGPLGGGTVFRITPAGAYTVLHAFNPATEGISPDGGLILASDGFFYGTTTRSINDTEGGGIFRMDADGNVTFLHYFNPATDGAQPALELLQSSDGHIYGVARTRGPFNGGTLYQLKLDGTFTVLHAFGDTGDGRVPSGGVIEGRDGALYGTTAGGGLNAGVIYRLAVIPESGPTITSAAATTFAAGTAGLFVITTTGSPVPALTYGGALPDGVTFTDNGDGTATIAGTPAAGTGGVYPLTIAAVNGVAPDAMQPFTLTVHEPPRARVTVYPRPSSTGFGQPFGIVAVVEPPTPTQTIDGTVSFFDGTTLLGTTTLAVYPGGSLGYVYANGLFPGSHALSAVYNGNPTFAPSTSTAVTVTVQPYDLSTGIRVFASPFARPGSRVAILAVVWTFAAAATSPTGTVDFRSQSGLLGSAPLVNGVAQITSPPLESTIHGITAYYRPTSAHASSTSPSAFISVFSTAPTKPTSLQVVADRAPSPLGQPVTFTVTVTSPNGVPTGSVLLIVDGVAYHFLGNVARDGSVSRTTLTLSGLTRGIHSVNTVFLGSNGFVNSSAIFWHVVQ